MALERELTYYECMLPEWLVHYRGQFALIKGEELVGTYTKPEEAYDIGVRRFGNEEFLIRRVTATPEVYSIPALSVSMLCART